MHFCHHKMSPPETSTENKPTPWLLPFNDEACFAQLVPNVRGRNRLRCANFLLKSKPLQSLVGCHHFSLFCRVHGIPVLWLPDKWDVCLPKMMSTQLYIFVLNLISYSLKQTSVMSFSCFSCSRFQNPCLNFCKWLGSRVYKLTEKIKSSKLVNSNSFSFVKCGNLLLETIFSFYLNMSVRFFWISQDHLTIFFLICRYVLFFRSFGIPRYFDISSARILIVYKIYDDDMFV